MGYEVTLSEWEDSSKDTARVSVPDNTVDKWNMLASPHWRTLLKAYEIKNGLTVYSIEQHTEQSS